MQKKTLRWIVTIAMLLSLFVVMLGAYTRLTHAGLGCPDWPGCYGRLAVPSAQLEQQKAQANFPAIPLESTKAWTEMLHRYAAGLLLLIVVTLGVSSLRNRRQGIKGPWLIPVVLLFLIFFQAALGMWTVTWKLLPLVVMGHLLGGISIFACLCYFRAQISQLKPMPKLRWHVPILFAAALVLLQIALGGWVSANYAGISCIGFPQCNGKWLPVIDLARAFNIFMPIGANYQGGVLDAVARTTIQFIHRAGAAVVTTYLVGLLGLLLIRVHAIHLRLFALLALLLLLIQLMLGIANAVYYLPLPVAVAHNGVAAMLLGTLFVMVYLSKRTRY